MPFSGNIRYKSNALKTNPWFCLVGIAWQLITKWKEVWEGLWSRNMWGFSMMSEFEQANVFTISLLTPHSIYKWEKRNQNLSHDSNKPWKSIFSNKSSLKPMKHSDLIYVRMWVDILALPWCSETMQETKEACKNRYHDMYDKWSSIKFRKAVGYNWKPQMINNWTNKSDSQESTSNHFVCSVPFEGSRTKKNDSTQWRMLEILQNSIPEIAYA